jgi:hypothetical protein
MQEYSEASQAVSEGHYNGLDRAAEWLDKGSHWS